MVLCLTTLVWIPCLTNSCRVIYVPFPKYSSMMWVEQLWTLTMVLLLNTVKTSQTFKVLSEKYKEKRSKQIPHTCSRRGMVRLAEDMKKESPEPSKVKRLKVWVKSRTKKDGTPVNTNAAEKIRKAAEVDNDAPSSLPANPRDDLLSQILGSDNPGRLRVMGRGMSVTKLACFQGKSKCMNNMQDKVVIY